MLRNCDILAYIVFAGGNLPFAELFFAQTIPKGSQVGFGQTDKLLQRSGCGSRGFKIILIWSP